MTTNVEAPSSVFSAEMETQPKHRLAAMEQVYHVSAICLEILARNVAIFAKTMFDNPLVPKKWIIAMPNLATKNK
jgi:hypothetical protein